MVLAVVAEDRGALGVGTLLTWQHGGQLVVHLEQREVASVVAEGVEEIHQPHILVQLGETHVVRAIAEKVSAPSLLMISQS